MSELAHQAFTIVWTGIQVGAILVAIAWFSNWMYEREAERRVWSAREEAAQLERAIRRARESDDIEGLPG